MKSIFDLVTQPSQLTSANQGLTNYRYQEVQPLRSVIGDKFSDGQMVFRWTYGSNKYWIPNKSYIKIRCKLTDSTGKHLTPEKDITVAMNPCPQLFQSSQYKIADQVVSQITENLAQVDTLKHRMRCSNEYLNGMGNNIGGYWRYKNADRMKEVTHRGGCDELAGPENIYVTGAQLTAKLGAGIGIAFIPAAANNDAHLTITLGTGNWADLTTGDENAPKYYLKRGDIIYFKQDLIAEDTYSVGTMSCVIDKVAANIITATPNGALNNLTAATDLANGQIDFYFQGIARGSKYEDENARRTKEMEWVWTPPISVFDVQHAIPCAGTKHEFTLTPFPDGTYQKNVIESIGTDKSALTDFTFTISDIRFYILTCDSNQIQDNFEFMLDFNEVHCQTNTITNKQQQQSLDVVGSTNAIAIAFQDEAANNDTRYSLSKFKIRDELELGLKRYYIRYEGQVPQPDFEGSLNQTLAYDLAEGSSIDTVMDLYHRTKIYDGSKFRPSPETLQEYRGRGMYIFHPFPKTASSRNTRVYVQTEFNKLTPTELDGTEGTTINPLLLLFQFYKKVVVCKVNQGRIVMVSPIDA